LGSKYEKYCSELSRNFKRHLAFRQADESLVSSSDKTSNVHDYVQKQAHLLSLLSMKKSIVFL
jgi:hypothetical protein